MNGRRYARGVCWALPVVCAGLVACGRANVTSLMHEGDTVEVPETSPLRQSLKISTAAQTTFVLGATSRDTVTVPNGAVVHNGADTRVYVEHAPWTFEPRAVKTGQQIGSQIEIASGLKPGERIVAQDGMLLEE